MWIASGAPGGGAASVGVGSSIVASTGGGMSTRQAFTPRRSVAAAMRRADSPIPDVRENSPAMARPWAAGGGMRSGRGASHAVARAMAARRAVWGRRRQSEWRGEGMRRHRWSQKSRVSIRSADPGRSRFGFYGCELDPTALKGPNCRRLGWLRHRWSCCDVLATARNTAHCTPFIER